jgi:hypothetical protein
MTQLAAATWGQRVVFRASIVFGESPLGVQVARVLEAPERFVQRRVGNAEFTVRAVVDPFADGEAVHRPADERTQHEQIERAVQEFVGIVAQRSLHQVEEEAFNAWWMFVKRGAVAGTLRVDDGEGGTLERTRLFYVKDADLTPRPESGVCRRPSSIPAAFSR